MGWRRQPRWDKTLRRWYTTVNNKKIYLGRDEAEAWRRFAVLCSELGSTPSVRKDATVAEAVNIWRKQHPRFWKKSALEYLCLQEPGVLIGQLKADALERLAENLKAATYVRGSDKKKRPTKHRFAPKTIKHYVLIAKTFCDWAVKNNLLAKAPDMPKLPKPVRNPQDYSDADLSKFFAKMKGRNEPMWRLCRFIRATGCRPGNGRLLTWEQIDLDKKVATCVEHKKAGATGRVLVIHLTPAALEVLAELPKPHRGYVFKSRDGKPYTRSGMRKICTGYGFTPYRLRHSFAQSLLDQGVDLAQVAALLGHGDMSTVNVYAQLRSRHLAPVAAKVKGIGA